MTPGLVTSTVDVMGATGGEVTVRVRSGDGLCEDDAETVHTILFQDCLAPGSISCGGVEVEGPPGNAPGEYRIETPATTPQVLDILIRGEVVLHPVTVIEGLTLEETAAHLAAEGFGELNRLLTAMRSPTLIADLDTPARRGPASDRRLSN